KRLIGQRRLHKAFGRGSIEFLHPQNRRILAFFRQHEEERLLVVANLSRFVQYVELDLSKHEGLVPVELFGGTPFPRVAAAPYLLTLAPHSFYWFVLSSHDAVEAERPAPVQQKDVAEVSNGRDWQGLFSNSGLRQLEFALRQSFDRE